MIGASLAGAHQFQLGVEQSVRAQSNTFSSSLDPQPGGTYRVAPRVVFSGRLGEDGAGDYALSYQPSYSVYFDQDDVDHLDNKAIARSRIHLTRRDEVSASASYTEYQAIQGLTQENEDGSFDVMAFDQGETVRSFAALGYSRRSSAASNLRLDLDFQDYGYSDSANVGNKAVGATLSYTRAFNPKLILGGSLVSRHRVFDAQEGVGSSEATIANVNVIGSYDLSESVVLEFEGGPTLIRTRPGDIVGFPKRDSDSVVTYFMDLSLAKNFRRAGMSLSYKRDEDASGGSARTSVRDAVSMSLHFEPDEFWRLTAVAGWNRRQSVDALYFFNSQTGSVDRRALEERLDRVWVGFGAQRELGKRVGLILNFRYQRWIENEINGVPGPRQENYSGSLSLSYDFHPYIF